MQKSKNKAQNSSLAKTTKEQPTKRLVETLKLRFDLPLRPDEIYQFRGAVADAAGWENNLFHNHGYRAPEMTQPGAAKTAATEKTIDSPNSNKAVFYRYPLIQYRSEGGKATIWAMNAGIKSLQQWLNRGMDNFSIGGRRRSLKIVDFKGADAFLEKTESFHTYRLMDWLALNQENYQKWLKMDRHIDRTSLLEEILAGQLLGFATAANWQIPNRFDAYIQHIRSARPVKVHGTQRIAFNLLYRTNLKLPTGLALGRSVAFGFGVQQPTKQQL